MCVTTGNGNNDDSAKEGNPTFQLNTPNSADSQVKTRREFRGVLFATLCFDTSRRGGCDSLIFGARERKVAARHLPGWTTRELVIRDRVVNSPKLSGQLLIASPWSGFLKCVCCVSSSNGTLAHCVSYCRDLNKANSSWWRVSLMSRSYSWEHFRSFLVETNCCHSRFLYVSCVQSTVWLTINGFVC